MTRFLARQDGNALVTALLVCLLVLSLGTATLQFVDTGQKESRKQRERDSSFQLAEGALNAQIYRLSTKWPGAVNYAYPASCTQASSTTDTCPSPASLTSTYNSVDYAAGQAWTTQVRDNADPDAGSFYSDAILSGAGATAAWDANADNMVWVRSEALIRGQKRVLVALVKADRIPLNLPRATLVADHFDVTNNGNKVLIDTDGFVAAAGAVPKNDHPYPAGPIMVRCNAAGLTAPSACAKWDAAKGQIDPALIDYTSKPPGIPAEKLELLRARAEAEGNYSAGCPSSLQGDIAGEVVWIQNAGTNCRFNGNDVYNSPAKPGVVVVNQGVLEINGGALFHGLLYHANTTDSTANVIVLGGNTSIYGSIQVAGRGGVDVGSSKVNLVFDPNYIDQIRTFGTAGIVQNSFREIRPGT